MFFAIITELAARSDLRRVPHSLVWSDYYRLPINMVFTGKCNFRVVPGGPFAPYFQSPPWGFGINARPHHGAFVAFPKQNDKCPTNTRREMCTLGIDWAILLCPAFVRSSRVKQIRRSNSDRAAGVEKTRLISSIWWLIHKQGESSQSQILIR